MTTASPSFSSARAVARLLLAALVLAVALAAAGLLQPRSAEAVDPIYACYSRTTYVMRTVPNKTSCTSRESLTTLNDSRAPIWICLYVASGPVRFAGKGAFPLTIGGCKATSSNQYVQIPGDEAFTLCVASNGSLFFPPCASGDTELIIPKRNLAPVAQNKNPTVLEDGSVVVQLSAYDEDGQDLTFAITQQPAHGSLSSISGTSCSGSSPRNCTANVTYTPTGNYFGPDTFKYKANDGIDDSNIATVTVTVTGVNDAPSFTSGGDVTSNEDAAYDAAWATGVSAGPNESGIQTVTFVITNNDNPGLFSAGPAVAASGKLSFTPVADASGVATITIKITDNGGTANGGVNESGTQIFTITVRAVNDRPTFEILGNQSVDEDAGAQSVDNFAFNFDPGPPDEAGQTVLDYKVSTDEDELFAVQPDISDTGTLTYTPADDASGVATIRVRVQDNGGTDFGGEDTSGPDPLEFTITIAAANDAPVNTVPGTTQTVNEDTDLVFSTGNSNLISVSDVDAGSGEVKITLDVDNGTLTLDSTNGLTFTPANSDNNGVNDATMTFTGTLTDVNAALSGMTYTPAADYNGPDTLTITTDDQGNTGTGGAKTDTDTVAITVTAVNDPPDFTAGGGVTVDEDSGAHSSTWATLITRGPSDESGQTLVFSLSNNSNPGLFSVLPSLDASGTLTFTPAANQNGTATLDVVLTDGGSNTPPNDNTSATKTLTINVTAVNDAPSFELGGTQTVDEDSGAHTVNNFATQISKGPSDEIGQTLTFTVTNDNNALFSSQPDIDETSGNLTYTVADNANGSALVTVSLADNGSNTPPNDNTSGDQTFTISVTAVNDAPVLTVPSSIAVDEDVAKTLTGISVVDIDAGSGNLQLTLSVPSGQGTFTAGPHSSFTVNGSGTNTLTIIASLSTINAYIGGSVSFTTALNAVADVTMTVTIDDQGNTGTDPGNTGTGSSEADTETVTLDVSAINDAPSFTSGGNVAILPGVTEYSEPWATNVIAGPADEQATQTVHFEITGNTNTALFSEQPSISATGVLSFTAVDNADGSAQITVKLVDDGASSPAPNDNESDPVTFTISTNEPPTISTIGDLTIDEDGNTGTITITITDPDGDVANAVMSATSDNTTLLPEPASYVFGGSGGSRTLVVTPASNLNGEANITVTVTDERGSSASEPFKLTVTAVNDAPTFTASNPPAVDEDASAQTILNWATGFDAGPADEDATQTLDHYTVTVTGDTTIFSTAPAVSTSGTLTYTLAANKNGTATFDVTVTDSGSGTPPNVNTSTVHSISLTVNAVNDAPSFTSGGNITVGEDSGGYDAAWATGISQGPNESGQVLTFNVSNDNNALFGTQPAVNTTTGNLSFTPAANANGSAIVTISLSDNGSNTPPNVNTSTPITFTITVTPVNDKPVINNMEGSTITFTENDAAKQLTAALTISDVDGTTVTGATVTIGSYVNGQDVLAFTVQSGITGNFDTTTGVLTFTASPAVTHAAMATQLQSVTYQNTSDDPTGGNRVISFRVNDGEAANNISDAATRTVNVVPVNDPPVFTDASETFGINENSVAGNGDGIDVGTNVGTPIPFTDPETSQTHTFSIQSGNTGGAFAVSNSGQITVADPTDVNFEVTPVFTLTVRVTDSATPTAGFDEITVTINLTNVNEAPTFVADSNYAAIGNTQLRINSPTSPATSVAFTTSGTDPLANDTDPDTVASGFATLRVTATGSCSKGGTLSVNVADNTAGRLVYLPPQGIESTSASDTDDCSYTISDGLNTVTGTLKAQITDMVWYVDNAAASDGDGRSTAVYNTLSHINAAGGSGDEDDGSDYIFLFQGSGSYTGGLPLEASQRLFGQPNGLTVNATSLITGSGSNPTITNTASGGDGITLANGVNIQRVNVSSTNDKGIVGSAITTATIGSNISITGTGGNGFELSGAAGGDISVGAAISNVTGRHVSVANRSSGTVTFSAALSGTGTGVVLSSNTGATIAFSGQLTLSTGATNAFDASGGGTVNVSNSANTLSTTTGTALLLNGIAGTIQFNSVSAGTSGTPATGIGLTNVSADVTINGGTIQNTTTAAISIDGSNGDFGYAGSISVSAGRAVLDQNRTSGGTDSFGGSITATGGTGIFLSSIANTINFTGTLNLSTGAGNAFTATNGSLQGIISVDPVSTNNNVLTTTSGTALSIDDTNISANGVEFKSISAGTSGTPVNGIVLTNTGTSGSLTVLGDGSSNGSGGTIQNTSGAGVVIDNSKNVSLNFLNITNPGTDGIRITNLNGFTFNRSTISDSSGTAPADKGIDIGDFSTGTPANGTVNITNSTIGPASGSSPHDSLAIGINSGTSTWNITSTTFRNTGNSGIDLELRGTAHVTAFTVTSSTFAGANTAGGTGSPSARGIFANNLDDSVMSNLTIQTSTFTNNNIHIDINQQNDPGSTGSSTFSVLNNTTMTGARSHAMNIFAATGGGGSFTGTISGNTIGNSGSASSGSEIGNGMRVNINGDSQATMLISGNTIRQTPNGRGIEIIARNGTGGLDVTLTSNDVNPQAVSAPLAAILVQSNCLTICNTVRADVRNNTVPSASDVTDLLTTYLELVETSPSATLPSTSTLELVDTTSPVSGTCASELAATNTGSTGVLGGCALIAGPINTP